MNVLESLHRLSASDQHADSHLDQRSSLWASDSEKYLHQNAPQFDASANKVDYDAEEIIQIAIDGLEPRNLAFRWGQGNYISFYNTPQPLPCDVNTKNTISTSRSPSVWTLSWDRTICGRKLICESHAVFVNSQELKQDSRRLANEDIVATSQQYRACIHSTLANYVPTEERKSDLEVELSTHAVVDMLWHLAEVILFSRNQPVLPGLLSWIHTQFAPHLDHKKLLDWVNVPEPELDPAYWTLLYGYAVRGMNLQMIQLLSLQSRPKTTTENTWLDQLILTIKTMPIQLSQAFDVASDYPDVDVDPVSLPISNGKFSSQEKATQSSHARNQFNLYSLDLQDAWATWKASLANLTHRLDTMSRSNLTQDHDPTISHYYLRLEALLSILAGDTHALEQHCSDWAIFLVSRILYVYPTACAQQLPERLNEALKFKAIKRFKEDEEDLESPSRMIYHRDDGEQDEELDTIGHLDVSTDDLAIAIFQSQISSIVDLLFKRGDWWFTTHFIHLLHLADMLPAYSFSPSSLTSLSVPFNRSCLSSSWTGKISPLEFTLLEYSTVLRSIKIPLRLLANYLAHCPTHGKTYLINCIEHEPINTQRDAAKRLALVQLFGLQDEPMGVTFSISQIIAKKHLQFGQIGSALAWTTGPAALNLAERLLDENIRTIRSFSPNYSTSTIGSVDHSADILHPTYHRTLSQPPAPATLQLIKMHLSRITNIVNWLGSTMHITLSQVQFFRIYCEILEKYIKGQNPKTTMLIIESFASEWTPKRFWIGLLLDFQHVASLIQLPQTNKNAASPATNEQVWPFNPSHIYQLLRCLEEIELERCDSQYRNTSHQEIAKGSLLALKDDKHAQPYIQLRSAGVDEVISVLKPDSHEIDSLRFFLIQLLTSSISNIPYQ